MDSRLFFDRGFETLSGNLPLAWQRRLFLEHLVHGDVPSVLDIPTGLGKTSILIIWLLALACQTASGGTRSPRRLVYVVNRRTVVDQATDIAEMLRAKLRDVSANDTTTCIRNALLSLCVEGDGGASPLAISTLRGELADNREWQGDPSRPAIIVGTVDMIGSRLLFSGYGVSSRMRPFHAGLLGQDLLLVHDEAHLMPAFGKLVHQISEWQRNRRQPRALQIIELSATQRPKADGRVAFTLSADEKCEPEVKRRLGASKILSFEDTPDDLPAAFEGMIKCALVYADIQRRVVIYVRSPRHAKDIAESLAKRVGRKRVGILTGTIRGFERDVLVDDVLFRGFRTDPDRSPPPDAHYLVATSAGEVGIDLDADHMVCDLIAGRPSVSQRPAMADRTLRRTNRSASPAGTTHQAFEEGCIMKSSARRTRSAIRRTHWW
jgi:CRISPR-associated endonuclease/helicase Cas3